MRHACSYCSESAVLLYWQIAMAKLSISTHESIAVWIWELLPLSRVTAATAVIGSSTRAMTVKHPAPNDDAAMLPETRFL